MQGEEATGTNCLKTTIFPSEKSPIDLRIFSTSTHVHIIDCNIFSIFNPLCSIYRITLLPMPKEISCVYPNSHTYIHIFF